MRGQIKVNKILSFIAANWGRSEFLWGPLVFGLASVCCPPAATTGNRKRKRGAGQAGVDAPALPVRAADVSEHRRLLVIVEAETSENSKR